MSEQQTPRCPYCGVEMKKWRTPANSTWSEPYQWICFNDQCSYFVRGWDYMMRTQNVKASYRCRFNPKTGEKGPFPCWSYDAHKDQIIED